MLGQKNECGTNNDVLHLLQVIRVALKDYQVPKPIDEVRGEEVAEELEEVLCEVN